MIVYCVAGRFVRTQAEARERAKAHGIQFNPEGDLVDVPGKQADLVVFLNTMVEDLVGAGAPLVTQQKANGHALSDDERFQSLPLSQRLDLAVTAIDAAHEHIRHLDGVEVRASPLPAPSPEPPGVDDLV